MTPETNIDAQVKSWLAGDFDSDTRNELEKLAADPTQRAELADRFAMRLEFGTAGLRGLMGAGPNRMNRAVVVQTAFAIGVHLRAAAKADAKVEVVVGYDGRKLSRIFAEDTACVLAAQGITAHLFADLGPTPRLAFATKAIDAAAGIMVTASHNPPEYNGYKVYWRGGAQIIPPIDTEIAARIEKVSAANAIARMSLEEARGKGLVRDVDPALEATYVTKVVAMAPVRENGREKAPLSIVVTAMHGVGDRLTTEVLKKAGFDTVFSVPEQAQPDGNFPTVRFPNPEEKGALDLAKKYATERNADLILANDPDADRMAACVKARDGQGYTQLTGNEVGVLLGHHVLTRLARVTRPVVLASIVSSPMLGFIARALGAHYEEVLTGFKWIANRAVELEAQGYHFVFGYEEALGYTAFDLVRDKDGVSACRLFADLVAHLHSESRDVWSELDLLSSAYGVFMSAQHTVAFDPKIAFTAMPEAMKKLRAAPPQRIGDLAVVSVSDYEARTVTRGGKSVPLALPKSNVLSFELEGGSRVMVRPSGTEPKTKVYLDARVEVRHEESVQDARKRAEALIGQLKTAAPRLVQTS